MTGLRNVGIFIREIFGLKINTPTFLNIVILNLPAYEDGTECSETTAYKIQKLGNYPKESIQHSEKGWSLKSSLLIQFTFVGPIHKFEYSVMSVSCGRESWNVFTPMNEYSLKAIANTLFNPWRKKLRLSDSKTQSVPRSKQTPSRL